jgi:tetratricopeptide (TPR) repeat protein
MIRHQKNNLFAGTAGSSFRCLFAMHLIIFLSAASVNAQADRKFIRQGNRQYEKDRFPESEILYRKAADKNLSSADALFNAGDALYRQEKYEDAGRQFGENQKLYEDKDKKSASFYNMGNSLLMANKVRESIEAYKNSLRLNPGNLEAKYNLAYAQDLLKQQEQQQQDQNNKDQNKDQDKNEGRDNQQPEQNKDEQQDNQQAGNDNRQQDEQQQQQQDQQVIPKEDAERLLNAIANDEREVQEKVKREKAAKARVRTLKNW